VFVSELEVGRIRRITPAGSVTTLAGGGGGGGGGGGSGVGGGGSSGGCGSGGGNAFSQPSGAKPSPRAASSSALETLI